MKALTTTVTLGLSCALVALSGCTTKEDKIRCDHAAPQTLTVNITVTENKKEKPKVDKEEVVACHQDDIAFAGNVDDFAIEFKEDTPFKEKKFKSVRGKAKKKVKFKPKKSEKKFKYWVIVDGYPPLDPYIIIRKR